MSELVITADGSHTLFVPELNEHYHSVNGAIQESNHVFLSAGYDFCKTDPLRIFEVGFGTGLNALLTSLKCAAEKRKVFYTSIEKYPLDNELINSLNYTSFTDNPGNDLFNTIHSSPWNEWVQVHEFFHLFKIKGDLITESVNGIFDLIYFDAFGPDKQPAMWSRDVFKKIAGITCGNGGSDHLFCKR